MSTKFAVIDHGQVSVRNIEIRFYLNSLPEAYRRLFIMSLIILNTPQKIYGCIVVVIRGNGGFKYLDFFKTVRECVHIRFVLHYVSVDFSLTRLTQLLIGVG
ncbi:hypothetical protein D3C78_1549240 [compost metagenome]